MNGKTFVAQSRASWNVVLTDNEINYLNQGISPLLIRPQHLIYYFPLFGLPTPDTDYGRVYILGPSPHLNVKFTYLILAFLLILFTLVIGIAL